LVQSFSIISGNEGFQIFQSEKAIMNGHHLVLGQTKDIITGEILADTHDERYRQKIAKLLLDELGYARQDVIPRTRVKIRVDDKSALINLDFIIRIAGRIMMILKYGPGSLVSRHRLSLALSRVLEPYPIPVVVVTNGEDADILNGETGKMTGSGLHGIPSKKDLDALSRIKPGKSISKKQVEMESRIIYAFEIDDKCPCDNTHSQCSLPEN
jgi:hypothetical protein